MNNKQLILNLKRIFDTFDLSNYVYTDKQSEDKLLYINQEKENNKISHKIEYIIPFRFTYIIISISKIKHIKERLENIYIDSVKPNIYVEILVIKGGYKFKVYDMFNKTKLLYIETIKFKQSFNLLLYMIHLISKK